MRMRTWRVGHRATITAALTLISAVGATPLPAAANDLQADVIALERATYGLPVDKATLTLLRLPGVDVGTAKYGFPLTADEDQRLDLNGRIHFADEVSRTVLPVARALPTFAGAYIDQVSDGSLVVMLTELEASTAAALVSLAPMDRREIRIVKAEYSEWQLSLALYQLRSVWAAAIPDVPVVTAGLDTMGNSLLVTVPADAFKGAITGVPTVAARLAVPIIVEAGPPSEDVACNSRDDCHTPLRAGVVVRAGGANANNPCTMAFHIRIGTDEQWMTAGHCGCVYSSTTWYHTGLGQIGGEISGGNLVTLPSHKKDAMRVQMSDAQASALMYADSGEMGQGVLPIANETIFASLGVSNVKRSGTVTSTLTTWSSNLCGVTVEGGDSTITAITGDSGSPLYRRYSYGGEWYISPIGVVDTAYGQFALVRNVQDAWNATIVTP